jgi:hypothetical protein
MSELTETFQMIGAAVTAIAAFITIILWAPLRSEYKTTDPEYKRINNWIRLLSVIALLSWLVTPWICYGVYKVAKLSTNQIEYCERPPTVIPKNPETIDLNKVEKDHK